MIFDCDFSQSGNLSLSLFSFKIWLFRAWLRDLLISWHVGWVMTGDYIDELLELETKLFYSHFFLTTLYSFVWKNEKFIWIFCQHLFFSLNFSCDGSLIVRTWCNWCGSKSLYFQRILDTLKLYRFASDPLYNGEGSLYIRVVIKYMMSKLLTYTFR